MERQRKRSSSRSKSELLVTKSRKASGTSLCVITSICLSVGLLYGMVSGAASNEISAAAPRVVGAPGSAPAPAAPGIDDDDDPVQSSIRRSADVLRKLDARLAADPRLAAAAPPRAPPPPPPPPAAPAAREAAPALRGAATASAPAAPAPDPRVYAFYYAWYPARHPNRFRIRLNVSAPERVLWGLPLQSPRRRGATTDGPRNCGKRVRFDGGREFPRVRRGTPKPVVGFHAGGTRIRPRTGGGRTGTTSTSSTGTRGSGASTRTLSTTRTRRTSARPSSPRSARTRPGTRPSSTNTSGSCRRRASASRSCRGTRRANATRTAPRSTGW